MSYSRITLTLFLLVLLIADAARAQDRHGFAVNAGIGSSVLRDDDGATNFKGNAFAWTVGAEYRFGRHFAFGLDVFDLGTAEDTIDNLDTEIDANGFGLFVRLIMPLNDSVELFARGGSAAYEATVRPDNAFTWPFDGAAAWGAGVDIGRGDLTFRLQAQYFDGEHDESASLLTAGLNYRF